ncbi:MAG: hypothetical protein NC251_13945 [Lachnoclostridium sp.]|nr:hypothetical protein [Lachnospiraceae bacterium]MCM1249504.1 hypothetical protein [Lachnoclostridium sp.]
MIRGSFIYGIMPFGYEDDDMAAELWRNAVYLACLILTNDSESCWNSISPKPNGITNQLYFRSADTLGTSDGIYEKQGKLYVNYGTGDVAITNACIAGKGTATTVNALNNLCTGGQKGYNVFYYHR